MPLLRDAVDSGGFIGTGFRGGRQSSPVPAAAEKCCRGALAFMSYESRGIRT